MNLNDMLNEVTPDSSVLGKKELPAGNYSFSIHTKEGATSPFKLAVIERETARAGRVAELGVYLKPSDEAVEAEFSGLYVSMPLVGYYDKDKNGNPFDTTTLSHSVARLLAAAGMSGGSIGVADVNTGQAIDLSTAEARSKANPKVKSTEVYLTFNGESITETLLGKTINAKISYKFDDFKKEEVAVVKFTR